MKGTPCMNSPRLCRLCDLPLSNKSPEAALCGALNGDRVGAFVVIIRSVNTQTSASYPAPLGGSFTATLFFFSETGILKGRV